MECY